MSLSAPIPGKDGKRLYVVGQVHRGELMRFDAKSGQFAPVLGAISAEYVDFSKNGEWVAYISYPEGTLWRSRTDGSERMQLTYPPMYPMLPRWSPDGKKIVFFEFERNSKPARIYEISPDGGTPGELIPNDPGQEVDPNWSPDGTKVVFAGNPSQTTSDIRVYELGSGKTSTLPGSEGLFSPRWSPDGRYVGALSSDSSRLVLYDVHSNKSKELAQGSFGWLNWSKDGSFLYVLDQSGKGAVLRVSTSNGKIERVVELGGFKTTGRYRGSLALAPDDSPLLLREAGTQDVYALDWEEP
jgi:Tol biopolymer transport system component